MSRDQGSLLNGSDTCRHRTIIISDHAPRMNVRSGSASKSRLLHLPNGVHIELIRPLNDNESIRRDLGQTHASKLLVYAGYAPIDMDPI